jgi:hypothetical protein
MLDGLVTIKLVELLIHSVNVSSILRIFAALYYESMNKGN